MLLQCSLTALCGHLCEFATPWTAARQASLSITNSRSLLKLMSIQSVYAIPASESFPESQASGGQSTGVSASTSVLPMGIQDWFPLGLTGWISLQSKGLWRVFSNTTVQKSINSSALSFLYSSTFTSKMTTGKTIALTRQTFIGKVMSLLFNMLSILVIAFLPRSKCLLISWLQSPSMWFWSPKN